MSLINQMLQELDARGNQAAIGGVLQGQVRAVPHRHGLHPAWLLALVLVCLLGAAGLWIRFARMAPAPRQDVVSVPPASPAPALSLKIEKGLDEPRADSATVSAGRKKTSVPAPVAQSPQLPPSVAAKPSASVLTPQLAVPKMQSSTPAPGIAMAAVPPVKMAASAIQQKAGRAAMPSEPDGPVATVGNTQPAALTTALAAPAAAAPASDTPAIAKQVKELTPRQLAENEYRKASGLIQQGRPAEAIGALEQALQLDSRHAEARQTLAALLVQSRRQDDAMRILRDGLQLDASQSGLAMILSRLQLERGELKPAIDTLQRSLPHAGERADYLAFLAALLQRDGRHKEAIDYYAQALRRAPGNGVWWMGQGISLQAENRIPEAIEAYKRAKAANGLSAELRAFVEERLNSL